MTLYGTWKFTVKPPRFTPAVALLSQPLLSSRCFALTASSLAQSGTHLFVSPTDGSVAATASKCLCFSLS
jgi:hypothetical protein